MAISRRKGHLNLTFLVRKISANEGPSAGFFQLNGDMTMTTNRTTLLGAAAALLLLGTSAEAADDKIVIGGAMSLTGVQAPLDTPGVRGAEVAVKFLNDNGGVLGKQ